MNDQAIRFRVGVFVLSALLLLAVLITLFGGVPSYFKPSTSYSIIFANALGVAPGTPVRRSGVKIGEVRKVELENESGKVDVTISVEAGYILRKGDKATLVQGLLGGDTAIAFLPPAEVEVIDVAAVEPGSVLVGYTQADTGTVLQRTAELMPPAQDAIVEAKEVFKKLDKMMPLIERTFERFDRMLPTFERTMIQIEKMTPLVEDTMKEYRDLAKATRETIPDLRKTNDEIRELSKATRLTIPDLRRTNDEIQLLTRTYTKLGERADILLQTNEDKFVKTLDRLQDVVRRVGDVLNDENQRNLQNTLRNVSTSSNRLDGIARNTEDFLKETRGIIKQINDSLVKVDDTLTSVQKVARPLGERGESIIKNVDESTDKLNRTLGDFRDLMQNVGRSDGSLQRLLTDPSLYNNLNETSCTINRLMPRMDRILRDVEIFADKIARHPESLGVGGVVRPGSGLKEAPTPYKIIPTYP